MLTPILLFSKQSEPRMLLSPSLPLLSSYLRAVKNLLSPLPLHARPHAHIFKRQRSPNTFRPCFQEKGGEGGEDDDDGGTAGEWGGSGENSRGGAGGEEEGEEEGKGGEEGEGGSSGKGGGERKTTTPPLIARPGTGKSSPRPSPTSRAAPSSSRAAFWSPPTCWKTRSSSIAPWW